MTVLILMHGVTFCEILHLRNSMCQSGIRNFTLDNCSKSSEDNKTLQIDTTTQEEWMIISDLYNSYNTFASENMEQISYDWRVESSRYTKKQLGEMPDWINLKKETFTLQNSINEQNDRSSFSEEQTLAYDIITKHFCTTDSNEPLLLVVNGVGGTGKSYLITAIQGFLGNKCAVTASTGKTAFNVKGIAIHSPLTLPVKPSSQKDLVGQSLVNLQERLLGIDYIIIDEYSMIGQKTLGWIDRRCRQSSGKKGHIFGGKSIILTGDPGQLPPVCDKPLYHSKPSGETAEQGYFAYNMFEKVVILSVNQRVKGSNPSQTEFRNLLSRLRNGESTKDDWKLLLSRQPSQVSDIGEFKEATRLFHSNEEVAKFNYKNLIHLNQPIAQIHARHSSNKAKSVRNVSRYVWTATYILYRKKRESHVNNEFMAFGWFVQWCNRICCGHSLCGWL